MKTDYFTDLIWKTANNTNIPNHKIKGEVRKLVEQAQKHAYSQAVNGRSIK